MRAPASFSWYSRVFAAHCRLVQRTVEVYTNTGELLTTYEGKIDIQYDDNRTLFDLDGRRYTINGGIVIVEEQ